MSPPSARSKFSSLSAPLVNVASLLASCGSLLFQYDPASSVHETMRGFSHELLFATLFTQKMCLKMIRVLAYDTLEDIRCMVALMAALVPAGARVTFAVHIDGLKRPNDARLRGQVELLRQFVDKRVASVRALSAATIMPRVVILGFVAELRHALAGVDWLPAGWRVELVQSPTDADSSARARYETELQLRQVGWRVCMCVFFFFFFFFFFFSCFVFCFVCFCFGVFFSPPFDRFLLFGRSRRLLRSVLHSVLT